MKKIKVYRGQALAIVMIVLVISAILGMAMLSRTLKDTQQIASEKSSAEALEFADSMLDTLKGTTVATIENVCTNPEYGEGMKSTNGCSVKGVSAVKQFLDTAGVDNETLNVFDECKGDNSTVELTAKLAGPEDELELPSEGVRSVVVRGQSPAAGCTMNFKFEPRGSSFGNVAVSRVYARSYSSGIPGEYKAYEYDDLQQYCVHILGSNCVDNDNVDGTWTPLQSGSTLSVPLTTKTYGGLVYNLDEIRVRSIGGTVAIKTSVSSPTCLEDWEMVKITTGANCTGTYRAKEVQIPQQESALSLFDYVLFNGNGVLGSD
ncbi:hypothetical protein HYV12_00410 [Candidatus Dojkabacteria bacterium]|nr:hypothetical protein [Candidatus Dojkabacteria bacterium]